MPEFLGGREDQPLRQWTVVDGVRMASQVRFDFDTNTLTAPFGGDPYSRILRARELMRAQISVPDRVRRTAILGCSDQAVDSAELFRIHTLLQRSGFALDDLVDGSERFIGEREARLQDWRQCVLLIASIPAGAARKAFLAGVRSVDKSWAVALERVGSTLDETFAEESTELLASTVPDSGGLPLGFSFYAELIGREIDTAILAGLNVPPKTTMAQHVSAVLRNKAGVFAELKLDSTVQLGRTTSGRIGKKRTYSPTGNNPRNMHRALTDPQRRVFSRYINGQGGIVIIDQSLSMDFSEDDLWRILHLAPGSVIIGYSHTANNFRTPNAWIIAERGRVCTEIPAGGQGNGVDGPVLRFALSKRHHREPVIWVTDGVVTDGQGDEWHRNLAEECLALIRSHGIHMVQSIEELEAAIQRCKRGEHLGMKVIGPMLHLVH